MNAIIQISPAVHALLSGTFGDNGLPMPFVKEIFLIECHIAGTAYKNAAEIEATLLPNDLLILHREPTNEHDKFAIAISDRTGNVLGYIPRAHNEILARLMDVGKFIFAKIETKEWHHTWLKITVRIYLRD
ncbi:MAG: HIRAN domain-containing protein [Ignavibacteria bacterium]|nr:HIRAN domain-containing protein [Ignavibacteria bacterium]